MGQNFSWLEKIGHELWTTRTKMTTSRETSEMQFEEYALKLNAGDCASRLKAKAKPRRCDSASSSTRNYTYWGENLDWCWTRKIFAQRLSSVEEADPSSSSWKSTSRQWWSDWILENKRSSSGSFCVLSSLVWRKVEKQHGRRRRTQEKISVLYWFFRNNSVPPSSPRSFRTQSYWSFITGQCRCSGRFLSIHLSCRMCNHFTFHHQFRIDTRRTKIWATDRQYSFCLWILWTKNTRILTNRKGSHNETDVWHIWKVDSRTIRWDLWSENN